MTARSRLLAAAALAYFAAGAAAQGQFIQSPPLAQTVTTAVGAVAPGPTQVPIITWGGDIATVLANGNAKATSKTSIFGKLGLNLRLAREDVFAKQLEAYLSGRSPYLRGTLGMVNMATEAAGRDPRTKPVVIYQLTWSAGGDALVVKGNTKTTKDLRGKTVAVQAYGPHVDYLSKILADAGLTPKDVTIRWTSDLTGSAKSPAAALHNPQVDAALVIIPDALALTSSGTVGTGAEDSVKGARILLSTKTANRIIADVYAVRSDFFESNRADGREIRAGTDPGRGRAAQARRQQGIARSRVQGRDVGRGARIARQPAGDLGYRRHVPRRRIPGVAGNAAFFGKADNPRSFAALNKEIQSAFSAIGLMAKAAPLEHAGWDYRKLGAGADVAAAPEARRFDAEKVATMVARKQSQGKLQEGELFSFEVFFKPNQDKFTADLYGDAFKRVAGLAATYGGAIITVEGHSDPMAYLRAKRDGSPDVVLGRTQQSAKNLSLSRAIAVRDSLIAYAKTQGVSLDPTQFAVVGHGITQPKTGICGSDPCPPKTEADWQSNMRVEFRILQVEAEASAFKPL
jgi:outer membrane protein OmpA-like peptidoglycan-associated protein